VLINSQVTKLLIDKETVTATGVEYVDKSGNKHTISARKGSYSISWCNKLSSTSPIIWYWT
ncbi:hypothetical protein L9F63_026306, partial [Diploptera punctata]